MIRLIRPVIPDMSRVAAILEDSFVARMLSNRGPAVRRLEGVLSSQFGFGQVALTSSGHTALEAAVATSKAERWAIPAFTFESTRLALRGREVVYVDVDCYGHIDYESLREAKFDGMVAVCPISSIPDFVQIREIVGSRDVVVDAAATFGSPIGTEEVTCVSFHATKTLPFGEGGAVYGLTVERRADVLRYINFGLTDDGRPSGNGTNAKMSDYTAAVGLALLECIESELEARRLNAQRYNERLGRLVPTSSLGERTVYQVMPTFFSTSESATKVRRGLTQANVEHKQYYRPLVPLPGAVSCYERNVCLPVHGGLSVEDVDHVCDVVMEAL